MKTVAHGHDRRRKCADSEQLHSLLRIHVTRFTMRIRFRLSLSRRSGAARRVDTARGGCPP